MPGDTTLALPTGFTCQALSDLFDRPPVQGGERKLAIGHAARSYVALYHYIEALDTAFVLALRSQLEAGIKRSV